MTRISNSIAITGLRANHKPYDSVPKLVSGRSDASSDQLATRAKRIHKTNIHYKNANSPYLKPVLEQDKRNRLRDVEEDRQERQSLWEENRRREQERQREQDRQRQQERQREQERQALEEENRQENRRREQDRQREQERQALEDGNRHEDRPNESRQDNDSNKGQLIKSLPRNDLNSVPKRRVVIRKVIKQKRPLAEDRADESVTPSVYQLLDDYRKTLPDEILAHKEKAREFRDSIVDNYMNNDKPNYIINDKDFEDSQGFTVPTVSGEGDESDHIRDFDQDFNDGTTTEKPRDEPKDEVKHRDQNSVRDENSLRSRDSLVKVTHSDSQTNNQSAESAADKTKGGHFLNTDAIVKQQREHNSVSPATGMTPFPLITNIITNFGHKKP